MALPPEDPSDEGRAASRADPGRRRRVLAVTLAVTALLLLGSTGLSRQAADSAARATATAIAQRTVTAEATQVAQVTAEAEATAAQRATVSAQETVFALTPEPTPLLLAAGAEEFEDWDLGDGWRVRNGLLSNDGSESGTSAFPPNVPVETTDYAAEVEARIVGLGGDADYCFDDYYKEFGIGLRESDTGYFGLFISFEDDCDTHMAKLWAVGVGGGDAWEVLAEEPFSPGDEWHTYRIEAEGPSIRVYIDGEFWAEVEDRRFPTGRGLRLYSNEVEIDVRRYEVVSLEGR